LPAVETGALFAFVGHHSDRAEFDT
jgi:hypothetical protein